MDEDAVDRLYGLPLEAFVRERDALAKRLRQAGDRAAADEVKRLPKPTRAAAAVNRLVRERPDEVRGLVEAGEALAGAQEELLGGGAPPRVLRDAMDAARRLVDALAAAAAPEGPTREKVRATLHAATVDPEVRAQVAAGRIAKERAAAGFGGLDAALAAAPAERDGEVSTGRPRGRAKGTGKRVRDEASAHGSKAGADEAAAGGRTAGRDEAAAADVPAASPSREPEPEPEPEPPREDPREVRRRRDALRRAKEAEAEAADAVAGARRALDQVEATLAARRRDLRDAEAALVEARARRERAERAAD